jgi:hypothetical protein
MNDDLERIWKGVIMGYFEVLSQNLPEDTEKNHEILQVSRCHSHFRSLHGRNEGIIEVRKLKIAKVG